MILDCLQIYRELLSLVSYLRVHSNSKEVSYLSWQNIYPNLKTTCHVKLKIFSWTKLLEWTCLLLASKELNSLLAKYLISVTAPLNTFVNSPFFKTCKKWSIACAFLRSEKLTGRVKLYSTRNSNHRLCFRLKISTVV